MAPRHRRKTTAWLTVGMEIAAISVSLAGAITAARLGVIDRLLEQFGPVWWLYALVAGVCYSSVFTVAPATVALGTLAVRLPPWQVAVLGGFGAMLGDLVVFQFIRSAISRLLLQWARARGRKRRRGTCTARPLRWPAVIVGALLIASPLPDEAGLALLGISHLPTRVLLPLTFGLNGAGIFLISLTARSLAAV